MDNFLLNWLKDVGIATAVLLVLGRVMFLLLQSTAEFYRGVREDNRARNRQVEALLAINKAIARQMVLTRQAMARSSHSSQQQEQAIRANVEEIRALREDLAGARREILEALADEQPSVQTSQES